MQRTLTRIGIAVALIGIRLAGQSTDGSIVGVVRDASGGAVEGAGLRLRNLDENTVSTSESASRGRYEFVNLKPGRYSLTAGKAGFAEERTPEIVLEARQMRRADFTLAIAPQVETVEVT